MFIWLGIGTSYGAVVNTAMNIRVTQNVGDLSG
jgi:hypothetical protein